MKHVDFSELWVNFYNFFLHTTKTPSSKQKKMEQHVGGAFVFTAGAV